MRGCLWYKMHEIVYPRLVRAFYANLKVHHDVQVKLISSEVKLRGIWIEIDTTVLGIILSVHTRGVKVHNLTNWSFGDGLNIVRTLLDNPELAVPFKPKTNQLPPRTKILHHIVTSNLLPTKGHKDELNFNDLHIMYLFLSSTESDICTFIFQKMIDATINLRELVCLVG